MNGKQLKHYYEAQGYTDIHGGPEEGGAFWRGIHPTTKKVVALSETPESDAAVINCPALDEVVVLWSLAQRLERERDELQARLDDKPLTAADMTEEQVRSILNDLKVRSSAECDKYFDEQPDPGPDPHYQLVHHLLCWHWDEYDTFDEVSERVINEVRGQACRPYRPE